MLLSFTATIEETAGIHRHLDSVTETPPPRYLLNLFLFQVFGTILNDQTRLE